MAIQFNKRQVSLAVAAFIGSATLLAAPQVLAGTKVPGKYVAGDFHNHTTCSDGSISMQKLVKKVTDKTETPWGLDWFVQAGHGGNGSRNCSLVEDATLETPAYPFVAGKGPTTTWENSIGAAAIKGNANGTTPNRNMWRWQSMQEVQYQVLEHLSEQKNLPVFLGMESVVAGHEHSSMSVITGQMPAPTETPSPLNVPGYTPLGGYVAAGNATALAQWSYCFDRGDTDTSRGNITGSTVGNNWNCSVTGSANAADASWNATAQKLMPASGAGVGTLGHLKTVEAMKWMKENHPNGSYYVPAHLERAGPFNPDGNNGFNIEHLRNFNNAAPTVAFGFETQPGHGASANRGEYQVKRNTIAGVATDSVGGTTYGGTGIYGAQLGGVWDALLGEGRNFWFFASSDWHNRGSFGPDDRRSTQDFYPGEYQRNYTMVRNNGDKLRPQKIVDGLRTGNNFATSGQLIDRLAFVACASYAGLGKRTDASVEALAVAAASNNTDIDTSGCATMGEKLVVRPGAEIVVSVVVHDPDGANYSPYTFSNPSLMQVGINQPLNMPVLDHIDLIRGMVTGYKTPGAADYAGEWPRNTAWLAANGTTAGLAVVPAAAKNMSSSVIKTFNGQGTVPSWTSVQANNLSLLKMTFRIPAVSASQYVRLRGSNLPASVPFETDASGNPLSDLYTNAGDLTKLAIACTTTGSNLTGNAIDGCPAHLPVVAGQKMVAYDVAAWSDLWFYSNPIYIQVNGSTTVAGVQ
ncbi:hypothetical protein DIC66_16710 [Rhodoferax lacus]|uniref:DUF3604 domain-containing protein n=1 Tax=Rhodoferax lacus TaxID=2184758 RepID=A0A3E1R8Z4_9BURK|nr:hypothetical protein [Rhodoferax lacus]RFO95826.1 hypothetical protein DIC66_16710 [Rhodoferax lacus]